MSLFDKIALNESWGYIPTPLSPWQISTLSEIDTESGKKCLVETWLNDDYSEVPHCGGLWDNVYCWPPTLAGVVATKQCVELFHKTHHLHSIPMKGIAKRTCLSNGSWAQESKTVYEECVFSLESHLNEIEEHKILAPMVHHMLFIGSILSLICLGTSLSIFRYFRCLHCDRVTVQTHLMLSLVLRFVLMAIIAEPLFLGHTNSYRNVDILCELVLILFLYSTFASVSWMFVQGLYLNVTLMSPGGHVTTRNHLLIYYIIGWAVPAGFTLVYVIFMSLKKQERCWDGYSEMTEMWILLGPVLLELVVNGLFLINILRILLRKIRNSNSRSDSSQIKSAAKATAILFPVLGINNLILLYNPGGAYNKFFVSLNTFFGSTQGVFVAIVYCFTNKDVLAAIKRSKDRINARRSENFLGNAANPRFRRIEMIDNCRRLHGDHTFTCREGHTAV